MSLDASNIYNSPTVFSIFCWSIFYIWLLIRYKESVVRKQLFPSNSFKLQLFFTYFRFPSLIICTRIKSPIQSHPDSKKSKNVWYCTLITTLSSSDQEFSITKCNKSGEICFHIQVSMILTFIKQKYLKNWIVSLHWKRFWLLLSVQRVALWLHMFMITE